MLLQFKLCNLTNPCSSFLSPVATVLNGCLSAVTVDPPKALPMHCARPWLYTKGAGVRCDALCASVEITQEHGAATA